MVESRVCLFVLFAYSATSGQPQGLRETMVYLEVGRQSLDEIPAILAAPWGIEPEDVTVLDVLIMNEYVLRSELDQARNRALRSMRTLTAA